jgi:two-component system NtrC family sensor kinase
VTVRDSSPESWPGSRVAASGGRLGLRALVGGTLLVAFLLSSALMSYAVVQLAERAREQDRVRDAGAAARAMAVAVRGDAQLAGREAEALVRDGAVAGVTLIDARGVQRRYGSIEVGARVEALVEGGGLVRLAVRRPRGSVANLGFAAVLYALTIAGLALIVTYVVLGQFVVRPVDRLTSASERLASGRAHAEVPERGAREVARLAATFNAMAAQLRADRAALEARLVELERTTRELRAAQEGLVRSEKLASVGRLAAGIAHEIGNPLAAILGLVELLRGGGLEPNEEQEFLARVGAETQRIHRIIRDLLDFSRQSQEPDAARASADLREVVGDAVRLVAPQKDLRRVTIQQLLDEATPRVQGSADHLTQVILNLLLNAADAVGGEGNITITVAPVEGGAELVVADSGPGIAPAVLDTLFEPFVTTKPAGTGTGLGLAVCQTIIERAGGRIRARNTVSEDGAVRGARIAVWLPKAPTDTG